MDDIRTLSKYFLIGSVFHACIVIVFGFYFYRFYGSFINSLIVAFNVAVVLAVGLIKGGRLGAAFGASYFLPSIILMFLTGYPYYYYRYSFDEWTVAALQTFILVVYGYIPASFYLQQKTRKALMIGFLFAFLVDLIAFFPSTLGVLSIFSLVFGGVSALLCFRHLRPTLPPPPPPPPLGVTPTRKPYSSPQSGKPVGGGGVRCPSCGHNNPSVFNYCGKCGSSLKVQEETQIY